MNSFTQPVGSGRWVIGLVSLLVVAGVPLISGLAADPAGEQATGRVAAGQRMVMSWCTVCHSTDLIVQQRLSREQWTVTVSKMVHWGAQLSENDQALVVDYLAERYRPGRTDVPGDLFPTPASGALASPNSQTHPPGRSHQGHAVYQQNCLPCHGETASGGVGPSLAKNPILMDEPRFWKTVREGRGVMPAWGTMLTAQEIADIQAWLKTLD